MPAKKISTKSAPAKQAAPAKKSPTAPLKQGTIKPLKPTN